jgi:hypothetical protein
MGRSPSPLRSHKVFEIDGLSPNLKGHKSGLEGKSVASSGCTCRSRVKFYRVLCDGMKWGQRFALHEGGTEN